MINTGLLMRKPGESGYGRYRRFLIANKGTHLDLVTKKKNLTNGHNIFEYRLASYAELIEYRFLKKFGLNIYHSIPIKSKYKPVKSCSSCMSIGFHSYVFDYEWLEQCPVHKTKLVNLCPDCNLSWPTYSGLKNRNCLTCGNAVDSRKLAKLNEPSSEHYEVFDLIEDIVEKRSKCIPKDLAIAAPQFLNMYTLEQLLTKCINSKSILIFSVLNKMNMLNTNELKTLELVDEIDFIEMFSVTHSVERIKHLDLFYRDLTSLKKQKSEIETHFENDILKEINSNSISHDIGSCINNFMVCSSCLPWIVYLVILRKIKSISKLDVSLPLHLDQLLYNFSFSKKSILRNEINEKLILFDFKTYGEYSSYIKLPDEIFFVIYRAEIERLVSNIYRKTKDFEHEESVNWAKFATSVLMDFRSTSLDYSPLSLSLKGNELTALVPSKYLGDLGIKQTTKITSNKVLNEASKILKYYFE